MKDNNIVTLELVKEDELYKKIDKKKYKKILDNAKEIAKYK